MKLKLGKRLRGAKKSVRQAKRRRRKPTLRKRIMRAFALVVILSVLPTAIIAFSSTAYEFDAQTEMASHNIAREVSLYMSEQYAISGSWENIDPTRGISTLPLVTLIERPQSGLLPSFDSGPAPEADSRNPFTGIEDRVSVDAAEERGSFWPPFAGSDSREDFDPPDLPDPEDREFVFELSEERWRGLNMEIVTDDGFHWIQESGSSFFAYNAESTVPILDIETNEWLGEVTATVTDEYFGLQTNVFFEDLLASMLVGSSVVMAVSLLTGMWLARRIAAPVTALTQATQVLAEKGNADHLPITSADELGQMSASFNRMVDKLRTQRKLRKRLLSDVSHELNTPLTVIQLEATGIKDGIQAPADAADQIIHEIEMLRNLVYDLNWLSETDVGEIRLNTTSHSLKSLLGTEVERWQTQARTQQVSLTLQLAASLPVVDVDELRMSQALGNLLRNALQHTPAGGRIMVSAEKRAIHQAEGDWIVIKVQDSGEGIDSAELQHIFERLYRADNARSRQQGGRGLGLSITRQLVHLHGGHVWAESTVGWGSTFYIALPA